MSINNFFDNLSNKSFDYYTKKDTDYEKDGKIYCGICHKVKVQTLYLQNMAFPAVSPCDCELKKDEEKQRNLKEQENFIKYLSNREICFESFKDKKNEMYNKTFENSDDDKHLDYCKKWAEDFNENYKSTDSLLLYGDIGVGKSHQATCIANAVLLKNFTVKMTDFAEIEKNQGDIGKRKEYYNSLNDYDLLIIDDLGVERNSEYMQEIVFYVINKRINSNKPFIITTNLEITYILNCDDIGKKRIYDRLIGACEPLEFRGKSKRFANRIKNKQ